MNDLPPHPMKAHLPDNVNGNEKIRLEESPAPGAVLTLFDG